MESDELKSAPRPDDAFETLLRANAALPPLADDGFSRHVLVTLPPLRRRHARRGWIAAIAVVGGVIVLVAGILLIRNQPATLATFNQDLVDATNKLLSSEGSGAIALTVGSLWYAFRDRWRPVWSKRF